MNLRPPPETEPPRPDDGHGDSASGPDALTRLLEELARTPAAQLAEGWQKELAPGQVIGRFELLKGVGRGGFGVVFEARDLELGRLVAFKALRPGRALTTAQVDALRREAAAAAALNHPNVVTVHDFGSCPAGPYVIMELLRGSPLSQRVEGGPLSAREAVRVAIEVARALAHAHAAGVVHRDLKPGNVFLCRDGAVKVLDFGLAHLLGASCAQGGTPGYMAPEQCRGEPEDDRTDLFGLGALLYRMLTGLVPFLKDGQSTVLDEGASLEPLGQAVPPRLATLVGKLLAKEPAARPASAGEALRELQQIGRSLDPVLAARRRRRRLIAVAAAVLAALGGAAAGLWLRFGSALADSVVTVAVADFVNDTGDPELDGLSAMLITSLEQSRKLSVLTRSRMRDELRKSGHADVPRIDEAMAREVGRATGSRALLLGSLHRSDGTYSVELRALDPVKDRPLFTMKETVAGKGNVPALIDKVSERTRRELRERSEDVGASRVQVGEVFTRNFEAYRHYFAGVECMDRPSQIGSMWQACSEHFRRALGLDPGFCLAHYQLAYLAGVETHDSSEARTHAEAAALRAEAAPLKERLLIEAWKHHLDGEDDQAIAEYRQLLDRYPDEKRAIYVAGDVLHHQGDNEHAIPFMQKALEIDPSFEWAQDHLAIELIATGRSEVLKQYARRWQAMPPIPGTLHALARARFGLDDPAGALEAARRYVALGAGVRGPRDVASVLFSSGDFRGAEREVRAAMAAGSQDDYLPFLLVNSLNAQGRTREALKLLDRLDAARLGFSEPSLARLYPRAILLASSGALEEAWQACLATAKLEPALAADLATDLALHGDVEHAEALAAGFRAGTSGYEIWKAVAAWKRRDVANATSRLRALDRLDPVPERAPVPSFVLAEIASEAGRDADVVAAVRRYQRFWAAGLRHSWTSPRALVLLASAQHRLGQVEDARKVLNHFLDQWSSADPDHPLLRQATALQAELSR